MYFHMMYDPVMSAEYGEYVQIEDRQEEGNVHIEDRTGRKRVMFTWRTGQESAMV